ncbi:hypothetical protein GPL15_21040 [Clostridium sp. MCC353]|uniref:hypothetical protein n=1 Tax=Clostridium sp. MCC353 TaxID=2592646 RepID=UPI001C01E325|nr:hypothetical protein [Clostridium sp. MCC353]MBT9778966.1 hypothetical protein [Clostridium sp. MCC353]
MRKKLVIAFIVGFLMMGIGGGISFAEFSSFTYGGEKILDGEMSTVEIKQTVPEDADEIIIRTYGYDRRKVQIVEDSSIAKDEILVEVTCNTDLVEPIMEEQRNYENDTEDMSDDSAEDMANESSQEMTNDTSEENPDESLDDTAEENPDGSADDTAEENPDESADDTAEGNPDESADDTAEGNPGESADDMPEEKPDEPQTVQPERKEVIYALNYYYYSDNDLSEFFKMKDELMECIKNRVIYSYSYHETQGVLIKVPLGMAERISLR